MTSAVGERRRWQPAMIGMIVVTGIAVATAIVVVRVRAVRNRVRDPVTRAVVAVLVSPWQRHVEWAQLQPMPRPKTDPGSALVGGRRGSLPPSTGNYVSVRGSVLQKRIALFARVSAAVARARRPGAEVSREKHETPVRWNRRVGQA